MTHREIEHLLGAYALDAVDAEERAEIEAHLVDCPRCRAEVAAHRASAAMLAGSGAELPGDLWERIANTVSETRDAAEAEPARAPFTNIGQLEGAAVRPRRGRRPLALAAGALVAAAAVAIVVLAVQINSLNGDVQRLSSAAGTHGLSGAVAQAALAPHKTVHLTSANSTRSATIIVSPAGTAYWVSSSLSALDQSRTYQLWGLSAGRIVSLALLGPNPHQYAALRVEQATTKLMVTAEPQGGTAVPTTPVLVQATVG